MQDLIFYVAANETLGAVRDYANMRNESAPTLVLGVSVCLRMRLFTERNVATPYPIAAFSGIAAWNWSMDGDYDHTTTCKLTADAGSITVHSVTDSINGETMSFTEFVIPISTMNTEELTTWLGTAESKRGLTGELVGYDTDGNAVFVLQIENFTVRNRVTGIGEPTSQNQELVTLTEAQSMIQYAISGATFNVTNVMSATSAGYAVSAGSAASAASAASADHAASAGSAASAGNAATAGSAATAGYAASAGTVANATTATYGTVKISTAVSDATSGTDVIVPTVNAMIDYVSSHGGSGGGSVTSVASAGFAATAGTAGTAASADYAAEAGAAAVASALSTAGKADIIASAVAATGSSGGSVTVNATYGGPFAVTASGSAITVAGGRVYLGGAEYATTSATLTSSNGTVYYYMYYSGGSYYSGCSLAASASALAAVIRGSQGYYTALANVQGGSVTQCHYGDIRIDGRVS